MDEQRAREILAGSIDGKGLYSQCLDWEYGDEKVEIDGEWTADELEAIAWWMRHKGSDLGTLTKIPPTPPIPPGPRKISENPPKIANAQIKTVARAFG